MTVVAESLASVCSCGSRLHYCGAPVTAKVLFPGGWDSLQHRRKRCKNSSCARYLKSVWYNLFVRDGADQAQTKTMISSCHILWSNFSGSKSIWDDSVSASLDVAKL